ncbi:cilium assembly protein DZIP1L [Pieris napi]|uniref:cilium assembly protein DZIP1L n=1 Tax=Pieris napi TaxID=78633 RepID=UPI001FBB0910|nr:cilium assembly protein DZIP1L [Pieris napi]
MACKASFALHHNFPKLAEEAGFAFNTHRPRVHIEWNKIRLLDVDSLIREKKFILIEQHINDILDCVLESEFDVRILDDGVVKIFRLAQLAVEYQQFCRHYLDRSVYVLREEITALAKELDNYKRNLRDKEDDMRRLRKRHFVRTPLPVNNENIATMILNSLKNQSNIFSTHTDVHHKCVYCDKVFLNQLYLKSHLSRRHPNVTEIPQRDTDTPQIPDESKLQSEIDNLKSKLQEMETMLLQKVPESEQKSNETKKEEKQMKDAEVLTNIVVENKIEDYRKQEFDKYDKELSLLRTQISQLMDAEKRNENIKVDNDNKLIEKLHLTIKQQGEELVALRQELINSKQTKDYMENERKKEIELKMANWAKKLEVQSSECQTLVQKLNETAKEVHEYKVLAKAERERAAQLEELLNKQQLIKTNNLMEESPVKQNNNEKEKVKSKKSKPTPDRLMLEKLQKQAQDLLNIVQSSTDSSDANDSLPKTKVNSKVKDLKDKPNDSPNIHYQKKSADKKGASKMRSKILNGKSKKPKMGKENGVVTLPVSPVKVVRAKITEEVNQRLVQLGVDPLKNRLPRNAFQKQRTMLQEQQEIKTKKFPSREKIYHSILTHLDTNTSPEGLNQQEDLEKTSPSKTKTFSLASVISNVKTKALSLVKPNDAENKKKNNPVTDRAMALLKSPSSMQSSPRNIQEIKSPIRCKINKKENKISKHVEEDSESESSDDSETDNSPRKYCKKITDERIIHQTPQFTPKKADKISEIISPKKPEPNQSKYINNDLTSDDIESIEDIVSPRKAFSEENLIKQTKGVLRNASSTSSLNKKKVLFDMDAIQMKSISASPSQSLAENSDNENYTLGIINLDADEWDPSSNENENQINPTIQVSTRTTPRIAELKQAIESQMARRVQTPSTVLAGSVNILPTPVPMARTSLGGSNTSLGSSILDESDNLSITNKNTTNKIKKDDSEIDLSELLGDDKSDNKF